MDYIHHASPDSDARTLEILLPVFGDQELVVLQKNSGASTSNNGCFVVVPGLILQKHYRKNPKGLFVSEILPVYPSEYDDYTLLIRLHNFEGPINYWTK